MKEAIAKLERILELTSTRGITLQPEDKPATSDDQLMYVESKIRLNAIQALDILDKNNIERQKPRVKTEFVKCEFESRGQALDTYDNEEELYVVSASSEAGYSECHTSSDAIDMWNQLYRKVETEIDERQEFIDECQKHGSWEAMYDSGKFKLVDQ
ncbi:hypothetical protein VPHF35G1_0091 [Vibrio phage F35 g1]|nr:putative lipocalin family protein [Vibrio phage 115E34-1]